MEVEPRGSSTGCNPAGLDGLVLTEHKSYPEVFQMEFLSMGFFEGIRQMPNIHPLIVHFPISLFTVFLFTEFINFFINNERLESAASYVLYLGTLAAVATVLAGFRAASTVTHTDAVHTIMESHEAFGVTVLVMGVVLSIWRLMRGKKFSPIERIIHLIAAFAIVIVLSLGADLGGLMVYKYGVGVKAVKVHGHHVHSHGINHDEGHDSGAAAAQEDHDDEHYHGQPHPHED